MCSLQDPGYQYPATFQPQTDADTTNRNALPDTSVQFDRAAEQGYGMLEKKKRKEKEAYVETKEFSADAYEQATNALEDEELEKGFVSEDVENFLEEQKQEERKIENIIEKDKEKDDDWVCLL